MANKVLITGAAGFIGSHLTELCVEKGYDVKAFIHYNSLNSWGWLENSDYKKDIDIIAGDIRDFDSVKNAMQDCRTVFHLAALIGIPYSYTSPFAYIKTNIEGTYNILQCAKENDVENIIITSTSETYGTAQYVPMDEDHPLFGQSPYSASKIAADHLAISFHRSFNLPIKIVRPFNTFGPRQSARAVIPTIITQLLENRKRINLGNLHSTRDFTYVKDTTAAFIEIAKIDDLVGQITNIGMNSEISIRELAELIGKIMGREIMFLVKDNRVRPKSSEVDRLCCNNIKIMKQTSWRPKYNLEKALAETIEWLKANMEFYKPHIYNV